MLPGVLGGDGNGEVRGAVVRFERGQVGFVVFAMNFDGTDFHCIQKLIGYQVRDIIGVRVKSSSSDRQRWCSLQGLC